MRLIFSLLLVLLGHASVLAQVPDFGRDIYPILSDKCFHCHGPDASARKAKLRLDTKEGAFRKNIIVPGQPEKSELIQRVCSEDAAEVMPPPEAKRSMTAKQKELLKAWIAAGAKWEPHWAFEAPIRPVLPQLKNQSWSRQPLDRFIQQQLEANGLSPQLETDKASWLRRVSLDLNGLPPTLAELDSFLKDNSVTAYEKQVDRLLASPRFGERMASEWLDVARYADTHGYQMDRFRSMWPWRDWVIKAFNRNLPYDQFLTEQLAGDLLPNPTRDQRLATAFNRLHMQNEEGGIIEEEYRVSYVVDRVNTFGTAFLGMTFDCTRCHDHKYDPFTMKDYYSLFSIFQNIDESGQTSYFTSSMPVPTLMLMDEKTEKDHQSLRQRIVLAEKRLQETLLSDASGKQFHAWLAQPRGKLERTGLLAYYAFDDFPRHQAPEQLNRKNYGQLHENPKLIPGYSGQAVLLDGENGISFPNVGHISRVDSFSISLWLKPTAPSPRAVVLHHSRAPIDAGSRGYELLLEQNRVAFGLHHMWPGNAIKVVSETTLPANDWSHVVITYDGSSQARGVTFYLNGRAQKLNIVRDYLYRDITYEGGEPNLTLGHRFRDNGFKGGAVDELRLYSKVLSPMEALLDFDPVQAATLWAKPMEQVLKVEEMNLLRCHFDLHRADVQGLQKELKQIRAMENAIVKNLPEAMVMQELAQPKPAYVLKRGAYDAPGEPVTPNTPAVFPPMARDLPRNRLGLARWLTSPGHPLTSRIAVNRLWQQMFGTGLVETSDNFGTQGARPSHPALLDWLALEFSQPSDPAAKPWDMQRLLKMIALSATYRQQSRTTPEAMAKDGDNRLLSRYPVRRLSAEMLRDQALFHSRLFSEKLGGPSVKPYQPDGLWEVAMGNPKYDRSNGPDLYRRSLYTFWKRTVPPPAMITFDAAERNVCIVRRQATSTPLQALALLNDVQMVEAAKQLGQRLLREPGEVKQRLAWAFRTVTCRTANEKEIAVLLQLWNEQRDFYRQSTQAAKKLLATGESKVDEKLPIDELAASAILALALFNHDEAVHRR
jgi:hypothetical protein